MKHLITYGAMIGMNLALLWHFSNIWLYGQYLVGEPNIVIRSLETAMLIAILSFGVNRFISTLRGKD